MEKIKEFQSVVQIGLFEFKDVGLVNIYSTRQPKYLENDRLELTINYYSILLNISPKNQLIGPFLIPQLEDYIVFFYTTEIKDQSVRDPRVSLAGFMTPFFIMVIIPKDLEAQVNANKNAVIQVLRDWKNQHESIETINLKSVNELKRQLDYFFQEPSSFEVAIEQDLQKHPRIAMALSILKDSIFSQEEQNFVLILSERIEIKSLVKNSILANMNEDLQEFKLMEKESYYFKYPNVTIYITTETDTQEILNHTHDTKLILHSVDVSNFIKPERRQFYANLYQSYPKDTLIGVLFVYYRESEEKSLYRQWITSLGDFLKQIKQKNINVTLLSRIEDTETSIVQLLHSLIEKIDPTMAALLEIF